MRPALVSVGEKRMCICMAQMITDGENGLLVGGLGRPAGEGNNFMSHKPGLDPARLKTHAGPDGTLAEPVFASLFTDWSLLTLGCVHVAAPRGTPVYAGTLGQVVSRISGAAVRGTCPRGTGWPIGGSR